MISSLEPLEQAVKPNTMVESEDNLLFWNLLSICLVARKIWIIFSIKTTPFYQIIVWLFLNTQPDIIIRSIIDILFEGALDHCMSC